MEKFFIPNNKFDFLKWILQKSIDSDWTITFEYSNPTLYTFLIENATETYLPVSKKHEYNDKCYLKAFIGPIISDNFIDKIISDFHVLAFHDKEKMIFLIADDIHEECFSCSSDFYDKHYQILSDNKLIDTHLRPGTAGNIGFYASGADE